MVKICHENLVSSLFNIGSTKRNSMTIACADFHSQHGHGWWLEAMTLIHNYTIWRWRNNGRKDWEIIIASSQPWQFTESTMAKRKDIYFERMQCQSLRESYSKLSRGNDNRYINDFDEMFISKQNLMIQDELIRLKSDFSEQVDGLLGQHRVIFLGLSRNCFLLPYK
jgi:hypothetical protein